MRDLLLQEALRKARGKSKTLRNTTVNVTDGEEDTLGRYSETYLPNDFENVSHPSPGMATIEVFDKKLNLEGLTKLLQGENFHLQKDNPKYRDVAERLKSGMTDDQKHFVDELYTKLSKNPLYEGATKDQILNQNLVDSWIRGTVAPLNKDEEEEYREFLTPYQRKQAKRLDNF